MTTQGLAVKTFLIKSQTPIKKTKRSKGERIKN